MTYMTNDTTTQGLENHPCTHPQGELVARDLAMDCENFLQIRFRRIQLVQVHPGDRQAVTSEEMVGA